MNWFSWLKTFSQINKWIQLIKQIDSTWLMAGNEKATGELFAEWVMKQVMNPDKAGKNVGCWGLKWPVFDWAGMKEWANANWRMP